MIKPTLKMNALAPVLAGLLALAGLAPAADAQEVRGDAAAGGRKIDMCIGCHGIVGYQASFPEVYKVPKISGQGAKYIASALNAYKAGERKHPSMRGIAASLTDQDIADLSAYYELQGRQGDPQPVPATPARQPDAQVQALLAKGVCVTCHGANFSTPADPAYAKLAGQNADYLYMALRAYKTDKNPQFGRTNGVMAGVVKPFSNAELKALAGYIGSLPGELRTLPESRFHIGGR